MLELLRGFRELAFPSICAACATAITGKSAYFCHSCAELLTTDPQTTCPRCCSGIGQFEDVSQGCTRCRDDRFQFDEAFRLGPYDGLLRELVLRLKQPSGDILAECVGRLWA